jgi:hypothetical protein
LAAEQIEDEHGFREGECGVLGLQGSKEIVEPSELEGELGLAGIGAIANTVLAHGLAATEADLELLGPVAGGYRLVRAHTHFVTSALSGDK